MKRLPLLLFLLAVSPLVFGQSPFATGAAALPAQVLAILTPLAVIGVMAAFTAALFSKISWLWFVGIMVGIVGIFGSDQIVTLIRSMFGV